MTCLPLLIYNIYAKQLVVFAHQHQTNTERLKGEQLGPTKVETKRIIMYVCHREHLLFTSATFAAEL